MFYNYSEYNHQQIIPSWNKRHDDSMTWNPLMSRNNIKYEDVIIFFWKILHSIIHFTYVCQWTGLALVQILACRLDGAKPLSEPMLTYCQLGTYFSEILFDIQIFSFKKMRWNMSSEKWRPFCWGEDELKWMGPVDLMTWLSDCSSIIMKAVCAKTSWFTF